MVLILLLRSRATVSLFVSVLVAIFFQPQLYTAKTGNIYIFPIANIQSFTSQIFGVVRSLGENLRFFSPLGFDVQDHKTQKVKLYSVKALKRYLDEKNLIHGRVMATISKFSPQIFEMYFNQMEISLYLRDQAEISEQSFISQILKVVGPSGE